MGTIEAAFVLSSVSGCFHFFHSRTLSKLLSHTALCDITSRITCAVAGTNSGRTAAKRGTYA
jgi:hypothetical protein